MSYPPQAMRQADWLDLMAGLADGLADLLLTDIPYGAGSMSPAAACASWTRARQ